MALLGLQPVGVPDHVMGFLVCYLLPVVALMLYEGWLIRQFNANQRLRAESSRASRLSASVQKAAVGAQEVDGLPALPGQHASSSMGKGRGNEGPGTATASDTGGHQQGGLVHSALDDLRDGNFGGDFGGSVYRGGGSVQSSSATAAAASGGQPAASRQFVYKRPQGCLHRVTVAVKVMHAVTIDFNQYKRRHVMLQLHSKIHHK